MTPEEKAYCTPTEAEMMSWFNKTKEDYKDKSKEEILELFASHKMISEFVGRQHTYQRWKDQDKSDEKLREIYKDWPKPRECRIPKNEQAQKI